MAKKSTQQSRTSVKTSTSPVPEAPPAWLVWVPPVLAFLVFCLGLRNGLLGIDDHAATVDNPAVTGFAPFSHTNLGMYAPLTWLGYAIAYALGKDNPMPYHFMSLAVHVFNVWLVYRLMERVSGKQMVAFWVAVLFAIHPIQVESVAWIAGFSTPLYAMFYLLACGWYLDYAEQPGQRKFYGLALLAFVLACLAKSAAVTLPLVLVLLDWWARRPVTETRRIMGYVPFFAVALLFGVLTIYAREHAAIDLDANGNNFSALDRLLVVAYTPVFYWTKLLLPLKLNIYYTFTKVNGQFPWTYWAAPVVLLGSLIAAWRYRQQARFVWFGLLFFFANLCVMLPFRPLGTFELCADHYNYVAAIGIFFILVTGVMTLAERYPNAAGLLRTVSLVWVAALLVLCVLQIRTWKDTISVVTHAIDNGSHQNGMLYQARATDLAKNRDVNGAIKDYSKSIEVNPQLWDSYKYRGSLYGMKKQYDKSLSDLSKYLEKYPNDAEQVFNRGLSLLNLGYLPEAIKAFDRTIELKPDFDRAYRARGNTYQTMGDSTRAAADLREYERLKK